jgi:CHAT domain-containing protein
MQSFRIAFVPGADPSGSAGRLATEQEYLDIERAVQAVRGDIEVTFVHAPTPRRVRRELEAPPPVSGVHYGGHGTRGAATPALGTRDMSEPGERSGVYLPDESGQGHLVPARSLAAILRAATPPPRLAVIMACHGGALASDLLEVVEAVVTMDGELGDGGAVRFGPEFWGRLAQGASVGEALRHARDALIADQSADEQRVRHYVRDGVDIDQLFLFPPPVTAPGVETAPRLAAGSGVRTPAPSFAPVADPPPPGPAAGGHSLARGPRRLRSCLLCAVAVLMAGAAVARILGIVASSTRGGEPPAYPAPDPHGESPVPPTLPSGADPIEDREPVPFPSPPHLAPAAPARHALLDRPGSHAPAAKHRPGPDPHRVPRLVPRPPPRAPGTPPLATLPAEIVTPPLDVAPSVLTARRTPAVPDAASQSADGNLDGDRLQRYIQRHAETLSTCFRQRQLVRPDLAGTVTATFVISASGSVESSSATGLDPDVARCVAGAIKTIAFPAPKMRVETTYRFHFVPKN